MGRSPVALETALYGGGCFWCLEAVFEEVNGVHEVRSGYCGGASTTPDYFEVCSGRSGHIEVVECKFDPDIVSYRQLLDVFFAIHDPTSVDHQGNDAGPQYRSVIFYVDEAQCLAAEESIRSINAALGVPRVVTELRPVAPFYLAEDSHQSYYRRHDQMPYCQIVIAPKLRLLFERFPKLCGSAPAR